MFGFVLKVFEALLFRPRRTLLEAPDELSLAMVFIVTVSLASADDDLLRSSWEELLLVLTLPA